MIDVDTYMRCYLSITLCFIIPTWLCFLKCPCNSMHYAPRYPRHNCLVCNIVLHATFMKYQNNFIMEMTTNWFLMYIYRLITWYMMLKKQQQLSINVSIRLDILWPIPSSIYVVVHFKMLGRLSVLK